MTLGAEAFPDFERIRRAVSERDAQFKRNPVLYPAELRRHFLIKLTAEIMGGVCTLAHPLLTHGTIGNRHAPSFKFGIGNPTIQQSQGNGPRICIHGRVIGSKKHSIRLSYERILVTSIYPNYAGLPNLFRRFFSAPGKNAAAQPISHGTTANFTLSRTASPGSLGGAMEACSPLGPLRHTWFRCAMAPGRSASTFSR
jgi:hypothetical protein